MLTDEETKALLKESGELLQIIHLEFRLNANDSVCTEFVITHFDK